MADCGGGLPGEAYRPDGLEGESNIEAPTALESWYQGENGRYLLAETRRVLQDALATAFGYHLLQLGVVRGEFLCDHSPINHRIYAGQCAGEGINMVCSGDELPLESDSVDAAIIHHGLEFADNPHQLLREVQRVLTPQGRLLVVGFNPWSLFGINARLRGLSRRSHWRELRFVSEARLTDWLHLLGCEVQSSARLHHLPLLGRGRLQRGLEQSNHWCDGHNLPTGSVYVLHAIKQVSGIHRPEHRLQVARRRLIGLAVPKPAAAPSPTPVAPTPRQGDVAA